MPYRREIDGLRALAVVSVMLFHAGIPFFSGGFVGVDIFFVISGYLITSIILSDLNQGNFSLAHFYERRVRRILPALIFVLLVCFVLAWMLLPEGDLRKFSKSMTTVPLFFSNFFFWQEGDYFETVAELKPLLHTWSLGVEEQFYIFFPPVLMFAFSKAGGGRIGLLMAGLGCLSFALGQIGIYYSPEAAFFLIPTRAWELLAGAGLAHHSIRTVNPVVYLPIRHALSSLGLLCIVASIFGFDKDIPFPSYFTLLPVVGTLLIIKYADSKTLASRILGTKLCVGVGLVSYSAYLWHQPLLAFSKYYYPQQSFTFKFAILGTIVLLAILTWRFVELPFRKADQFSRKFVFISSVSGSLILVALAVTTTLLFRSDIDNQAEAKLAAVLSKNRAVYAPKVDERVFIKYRVKFEELTPDAIILGSSRIMQIGNHNYNGSVLNLGVSGASIEDIISIADMSVRKFNPSTVLIGMDPWLFNSLSGQDRWRALEPEFQSAVEFVQPSYKQSGKTDPLLSKALHSANYFTQIGLKIFNLVNFSDLAADVEYTEPRDRIRRDGSRIYNSTYAQMKPQKIKQGFKKLLDYGMTPFSYSQERQFIFERFLKHHKVDRRIILVMSPYHPAMFDMMKHERQQFLQIEDKYRNLAARNEIEIVGSFDPVTVGCPVGEFFDGMHPNDQCMMRLLKKISSK
jgi:peptidoglycan/LPS O-acetylase OafA/YrhL